MKHSLAWLAALSALVLAGCSAASGGQAIQADAGELAPKLDAVRARGCPGQPGTHVPLRWVPRLAEAAGLLAQGVPSREALRRAGYHAVRTIQVSMSGPSSPDAVARAMAQRYCAALTDPRIAEAGLHREGPATWLVLAAPFTPPAPSEAATVAARVLALTNDARAQARSCGEQPFRAAAPLRSNELLQRAAAAHARDMAAHGALEHEGSDGSSPADRVGRAGYRWRSVGENIASGQASAEQVVGEWVRSPEHCANLMSPSFTEMGVAYAVDMNSPGGIYWAQEFGRPR